MKFLLLSTRFHCFEVLLFSATALLYYQYKSAHELPQQILHTADQAAADMSLRNANFPDTFIDRIDIDLTSPQQSVTLTWSGPDSSKQEKGPFHSSPGKGTGDNNCDDLDESNHYGSCCTPKGNMLVQGFNDFLPSVPNCKFVTWLNVAREVAIHSHENVPDYPASHGCIRVDAHTAQLIHNNSIVGQTKINVAGTWSRPTVRLDRAKLINQILKQGGSTEVHYEDGKPMIGFGFNLKRTDAKELLQRAGIDLDDVNTAHQKLSNEQITSLLKMDLDAAVKGCHELFPKFTQLSDVRQRVLAELMFALGRAKIESSAGLVGAIKDHNFVDAAEEIKLIDLDGATADRLQEMMKSNSDPMDLSKPIVDSHMTLEEALDGVDPTCPDAIAARLELVDVCYYSFDNRLHQGQLLIDHDLKKDIEYVFRVILEKRFPIGSVIPISHGRFRKNGQWSDSLSMQANNTSGFNYRKIADSQSLSLHALGRAIDINPRQNPHINGSVLQPLGATYVITAAGTLSLENPVVQAFLDRGWTWGGSWHSEKDFQHFSKGTGPDAR